MKCRAEPQAEETALDLLEDEDVKLHSITALSTFFRWKS